MSAGARWFSGFFPARADYRKASRRDDLAIAPGFTAGRRLYLHAGG